MLNMRTASPPRHAPIYIVDKWKNLHIVDSGETGTVLFDLVSGRYVISSAITHPIADSIDRYISSSESIRVVSEGTLILVLTLHLGEDALANLSLPTLKKIGISDETAQLVLAL